MNWTNDRHLRWLVSWSVFVLVPSSLTSAASPTPAPAARNDFSRANNFYAWWYYWFGVFIWKEVVWQTLDINSNNKCYLPIKVHRVPLNHCEHNNNSLNSIWRKRARLRSFTLFIFSLPLSAFRRICVSIFLLILLRHFGSLFTQSISPFQMWCE